jgi:Ca-activated chloride channel family protein
MYRRFLQTFLILLTYAAPAPGQVLASSSAQVERSGSVVRIDFDGRVARYEVSETFINRGRTVGEADYLLPLPSGAAFEDLALSINGEMVTGETMRADRARAVYEEIVRKMRDPALVEWMGHGLFRTRIFPIQPGEEKRVVVWFRAVVPREGDAYRVDWIGGATAFTLTYPEESSFGEAYSPTHELHRSLESGRRVVRGAGNRGALTILLPVRSSREAAIGWLAHAPVGEDGYALITVSPPDRATHDVPRDVVFVIDVSGSMSGRKIDQARAAGRQLLESLRPTDRFRLIDFSSDVRLFRDGWTSATRVNLRDAETYLANLRANGGTNIQGAIEEALRLESPKTRLPLVLFLTDGAPTVGETRAEAIAQRAAELRGERRLFTFGIGADVNAALMEQLALQGRGTATFVRPEESVERAVGVVTQRLTRPIATDVRVTLNGARLYGVQPQGVIDVFVGQDLVIFARYANAHERGTLVIEGRSADGPVRWTTSVSLPTRQPENAFVARLWAVQRVGYLSAERRRRGGNAELDGELRQLGERYGIPTELTSYLVTEPGMPVNSGSGRRDFRSVPPANAPASVMTQPTVASDRDRFEAAKMASEQRAATSLGDSGNSSIRGDVRTAGTHSFVLCDSVWTDTRVVAGARTIRVQAYSTAYFALVQRLPELGPLFAVADRVRVQGQHVRIEIVPSAAALDAAAIDAIIRDW